MTAACQSFAAASGVSGADPVIAKPSGTVDGDLLVCCIGSTAAITPPSGGGTGAAWNEYIVSGVSGAGAKLLWKIAASEPSSNTFVVAGVGNTVGVIARINGHDPVNPIDVATGVTGSLGNVVLPTLTPLGANRLLFQIFGRLANVSFTEPGTTTERWDAASSSANYRTVGGDEVIGSGATGSRTWTPSSGTAGTTGFMLAIKSAPLETTGAAAGTGSASAVGASVSTSTASASGAASVGGSSATVDPTIGSAAGTSTVAALGGTVVGASGSAGGSASAAGQSAATAAAEGLGAGAGTAAASTAAVTGATGSAAGAATGGAASALTAGATGAAIGASAADGAAASALGAVGAAVGTSTAAGTGSATIASTGTAAGSSTAGADSGAIKTAVGEASGIAIVDGHGQIFTPPEPHRVTITERTRAHAITERQRDHTIVERSRTTTIKEPA